MAPAVGWSGGFLGLLEWSPNCKEVSHKKMAGQSIPRRRRACQGPERAENFSKSKKPGVAAVGS